MTSNGSIATTLAPTRETLSSSQLLTSSISSLNSTSSRQATSQISKIYRQSSTLFLTRRLPESLSTILPVITPPPTDDTNADSEPAPISKAGKTTRVKVWSLYLTILNAVVELDPDEGKQAFGSSEWRGLVTKVRDGEVWEDVVKNGYGGVEGDVDSDVVINLATLLLAHARSQKVNQQRLENYLASSTTPNLDISSRLQTPTSPRRGPSPSKTSGTDTPRDLNARVKILELYTLHVLLRNNEWDYAREFISISSVLDEERREAFLQALQSLQDEQNESERREKEERRYQEEQLKKDIEDTRRRRLENEERERKREEEERLKRDRAHRSSGSVAGGSEIDYGVENTPARPGSSKSRSSARGGSGSAKGSSSKKSQQDKPSPTARSGAASSSNARKVPPSILTRAGNVLGNVKKLVEGMAVHFQTRPLFILQFLAFLIGFLVVLSRRDVKERLKRILGGGWMKVRQTAGMGVKVSYI
ncbi:peroxin 26 [Rhexocercosporidium sp. MPI-PUGE-AT-0058]|nr:peroxin 26 [Rhexocercosporidium sp. MPI-PUGE-AT-0058]